jgi:Na+-transporting NADH:ubiquinone oxidoreductase subunit NqrB
LSAPAPPAASFDARFYPPLLITVILLSAHLTIGILESPWQTILAITSAITTELVLGYAVYGRLPHLASSYITGISVGVLLRTPLIWPFAYCSILSIMSKYVIRLGGRHIWNPSNLGVSFMLFVYPQYVAHLSIQWGNAWWSVAFVWSLGLIVVTRLRRVHICLTYVASFLLLSWLRTGITGHPFLSEVAPITGPMYQLFILYMITDPGTTVKSKGGQMFVVTIVALMEMLFRCLPTYYPDSNLVAGLAIHAPFYALFVVGPFFRTAEILRDMRQTPS